MGKIKASELTKKLDETLDRVAVKHERILLERQGKPTVALVPVEDFARLEGDELPPPIEPLEPLTEEFVDEAIRNGRP